MRLWWLGGEGSPAGVWATTSPGLLKTKAEALPWGAEPQVQFLAWPQRAGSLLTYLVVWPRYSFKETRQPQ